MILRMTFFQDGSGVDFADGTFKFYKKCIDNSDDTFTLFFYSRIGNLTRFKKIGYVT